MEEARWWSRASTCQYYVSVLINHRYSRTIQQYQSHLLCHTSRCPRGPATCQDMESSTGMHDSAGAIWLAIVPRRSESGQNRVSFNIFGEVVDYWEVLPQWSFFDGVLA